MVTLTSMVLVALQVGRTVDREDAFLGMVGAGFPTSISFVAIRAADRLPKMSERINEIYVIQSLRGLPTDNAIRRFRALLPILGPLFVSMLLDASENAAALASKGLFSSRCYKSIAPWRFTVRDVLLLFGVALLLGGCGVIRYHVD